MLPSRQHRCCVMRYICHSSPRDITTSRLRQLQSGCCSGGLSPKFNSPIGALPLPHHDCYLNHCNKPLGTSRHAAPFLIATEGHPGKGRCILLPDTKRCTGPTRLLNDWGGGRSRVQGLAVTVLAAASFSRVPSTVVPPSPFPAMSFFAEEFSDRAFAAVHQRAGDLPANHKVFSPLCFSPVYPRHTS